MNILLISLTNLVSGNILYTAHVLAFGTAAVLCFVMLTRTSRIDDPEIRRGLVALLLTSGGWASAHVAFLVMPTVELKLLFYYVGLVIGLSAVGPWLYFCSAYTGRSLHREPVFRRLAVGVFLLIVAVKLTNPLHQFYFQAELVTTPFQYLAVQSHLLHWLVMGLTYVLASIGYFMLLELLWEVGHDTKPFVGLVGVTGLPVILDITALTTPGLINITYEPIGVAAFAVGVFFVFLEDFQTIRVAGESDDPVIVLDAEHRVRDYNTQARELFPALESGARLSEVVPEVTTALNTDESVVELSRESSPRYYQVSANPFTTDKSQLGEAITLTDITEREQYRAELERQNERLEQFASMVSHDLRSPLTVAAGHLEFARQEYDSEDLEATKNALTRMEALIEDLLGLARQGQPIDETDQVSLSAVTHQCWEVVDTSEATLTVDSDLTFMADPARLQQLLENLFRNAIDHGGDDVRIRVGALADQPGFYIADDGPGIPDEEKDDVFGSGYSTDADGTGFGLAIVSEIVDAHDWQIHLTDSADGGARFEVTGVEISE